VVFPAKKALAPKKNPPLLPSPPPVSIYLPHPPPRPSQPCLPTDRTPHDLRDSSAPLPDDCLRMAAGGRLRRRTRARSPPRDADVRCEACGSGEAGAELMLCDGCDRGYHIFCLRPILPRVPAGDWFCDACRSLPSYSKSSPAPKRE
jgi:hypothetical protein